MLTDGIQLTEGSDIVNLTVASGTSFPSSPSVGELFYRTDLLQMQVYNGSAWTALGSAGSFTITGDVTGTIDGSPDVLTLATVNSNVGSFGTSTAIPAFTVNGKGLITAASTNVVIAPAGTLTGTTLASTVASSSLTSVGTLGSLNVSGTATAGSFSGAGTGLTGTAASLNIGGTAPAGSLTGTTLASTVASSSLTSVGTLGSLTVSGNVTSSDPTTSSQLTTKNYVDNAIAGLTWKSAVRVGTTANITLSGTQSIDGVSVQVGDRVLVKNQTSTPTNGVYIVASGAWSRSSDFDGLPSVGEVNGAAVYIEEGTTLADTMWTETSTVTTIGTDPITFAQFSAGGSVAASSLTGSVLASNVVTSSLTSLGTLSSLSVSGAASAGSFSGAGTGLTGTATSLNIGGAAPAGSLSGTTLASNVVTSSLTSVGTLGSVTVTGAATAGSFSGAGTGLTGTAASLNIGGSAASATTATTANKATSLQATGLALVSTSTTAAYAGKDGNALPILGLVNASAGADAKYSEMVANNDGSINFQFLNDANGSTSAWMNIARTGLTATNITLTGTAITLTGAASATSLSTGNLSFTGTLNVGGTTGTAGQVLTSNGTFAPTWQAASGSGSVTSVSVTTANGVSGSVATATTTPAITLTLGAITPTSVSTANVLSTAALTVQAGNAGGTTASSLNLNAGASNTGSATGGSVVITTGGNVTSGSGVGNITIQGNPSAAYTGATGGQNNGAIQFLTGAPQSTNNAVNTLVNRLTIQAGGAWTLAGDAGTSGYVMTSAGAGAPPTWSAAPSALAANLIGTSLAGNVVNSSLTSLGTIAALSATNLTLTGTLTTGGTTGTSGFVLTSNGASAPTWAAAGSGSVTSVAVSGGTTGLTTSGGPITTSGTITLAGTLALANGGTGATTQAGAANAVLPTQTSNSGKYLTTDGSNVSWSTVSGGGGTPGGATTQVQYNSSGSFAGSSTFTFNSGTGVVSATGFAGDGSALTGLNASNLSSGTVALGRLALSGTASTTTFLRGDNTWATPTASAVSSLQGTGSAAVNTSISGSYAGLDGNSQPIFGMVNSAATANNRYSEWTSSSAGVTTLSLLNDANNAVGNVISVARSGNTATLITLNASGLNFTGLTATGLQLNGSAGASGQTIISAGASATPVWGNPANLAGGVAGAIHYQSAVATSGFSAAGTTNQVLLSGGTGAPTWATNAPLATSLSGGNIVATGTWAPVNTASGLYAGKGGSGGGFIGLVDSGATAGQRGFRIVNVGSALTFDLTDDFSSNTAFLSVARSSNTATSITLATTQLILSGMSGGLSASGSVGSSGQALISNGAAAPSWGNPANMAGGVAGAVHWQSAVNVSGFTAAGTAGQFLTSNGTSVPTWTAANTATGTISTTTIAAGTGGYTGVTGGNGAIMNYNSGGATDGKVWQMIAGANALSFITTNDALSATGTTWLTMARSGNAITTMTLTAPTSLNLAGMSSGLLINGAAGTAGNVLVSNGAATPTWGNPSALNGFGSLPGNGGSLTGVYAGSTGTEPRVVFYNSGATANYKTSFFKMRTDNTFVLGGANDSGTEGDWITFLKSFQTLATMTVTATSSIVLTTPSVAASAILTGGVISTTATTNNGTFSVSGVRIGAEPGGAGMMTMYASGGGTDAKTVRMYTNASGNFVTDFYNDAYTGGTNFLLVSRSTTNAVTATWTTSTSVVFSTPLVSTTTAMSSPLFTSTATMNITSGTGMNIQTTGANSIAITTPGGSTVGNISATAGAATSGVGGNVTFTAGNGSSTGGNATLKAGNSSSAGVGGAVNITAGNGASTNVGGAVVIAGGVGSTGLGGDITLTPGAGSGGPAAGALTLGVGSPAQAAAGGFPYMPAMAGAPSGVPTAKSGFAAFVYDTTNKKIWIYDTGTSLWKGVVVA